MEEDGSSTLLRRMLHKAAGAARAIANLRPSTTTTPATTPCRLPMSLLDCTDDDAASTAGSPSFHTASGTPAETVHSRLASPGAVEADIDRRAAKFIERFRRDALLELRNCSPVTPARPPTSPDTYFNISRLHGAVHDHGSPVRAYGRVSPRPSGMSVKWPNSYLRGRPSVQV